MKNLIKTEITVVYDPRSIKSIKYAEKRKFEIENDGFNLSHTIIRADKHRLTFVKKG
jgi:hypothetical protein